MRILSKLPLVAAAFLAATGLPAQESESEEPPSLGDLFKKVKDIKVPDSVSNLPTQLTELKEAYLQTAQTVEELQKEVEQLRSEVYALRKDNEALRAAVGGKVEEQKLTDMMKPVEVSATQLVAAFEEDAAEADAAYRGKYLKVVGYIEKFEAETQAIVVFLKSDTSDRKVRCVVPTGNNLYVDILPAQGRLVSRNDRRTLLSAGQPVTIMGSCSGSGLNVNLENCTIEGLVESKKEEE